MIWKVAVKKRTGGSFLGKERERKKENNDKKKENLLNDQLISEKSGQSTRCRSARYR